MSAADPSPTADRPVWGLSHVVVGLVLSLVASTVFMAFAFVAGFAGACGVTPCRGGRGSPKGASWVL